MKMINLIKELIYLNLKTAKIKIKLIYYLDKVKGRMKIKIRPKKKKVR
jgi:hypothetical protein